LLERCLPGNRDKNKPRECKTNNGRYRKTMELCFPGNVYEYQVLDGASVGSIILLFSKEFAILVGIAFAIASALAY